MIRLEDIITAYESARANKRRSPDQVEFELHWQQYCVEIFEEIQTHSVRPTAYTFVCDNPKPREIFASDMKTRILHHYLDIRLRPLLEARLSPHTFNNRVGMGQDACINAVISDVYEVSEGYTRDAYIIKTDIKGCFPNISQDIAYKQLEEVILNDYHGEDKDELLYILNVCVFSYPTHHYYRKSSLSEWSKLEPHKSLFTKPDGTGAAIGHLIWQNAVNYYFHEIDEWLMGLEVRFERYVDDFYIIAPGKNALLLLPELRQRLAALGATLHPHKFYCQHWSKGFECLGSHVKIDRVYLNNRTISRAKRRIREFNRCARESKIDDFLSCMNSYFGLLKNRNGYARIRELVNLISPAWGEFVHFDERRKIMAANCTRRDRLIKKYHLTQKSYYHDKRRNSVRNTATV